jgi:pyruvate/2-oxoglutarate/acetoin dehydrogenase E1 component
VTTLSYRQAITQAIADEMEADERVILFGEDVAAAGGVFKATDGLQQRRSPSKRSSAARSAAPCAACDP